MLDSFLLVWLDTLDMHIVDIKALALLSGNRVGNLAVLLYKLNDSNCA